MYIYIMNLLKNQLNVHNSSAIFKGIFGQNKEILEQMRNIYMKVIKYYEWIQQVLHWNQIDF